MVVDGEVINHDHAGVFVFTCGKCQNPCGNGSTPGLIINPGQSAELQWNGGFWAETERSEACTAEACGDDPNLDTTCSILQAFEAGADFTVRVRALETCPQGDDESCTCDDDVCPYSGERLSGEFDTVVEGTVTFPEGTTLVLE